MRTTTRSHRRREVETILHDLGARQHHVVRLRQLRAAGCTDEEVRGLVDQGRLTMVHRGVARLTGPTATFESHLTAATLAIEGAVASHRAACWLYRVQLPSTREVVPTEITVPRHHRGSLRGAIVHRSTDVSPDQVTTRSGIPVTDPYRLALDLGGVCPIWETEQAIEQLVTFGLVEIPVLKARLDALGGRRGRNGIGVARTILERRALGEDKPDSVLESMMARLLSDAGLEQAVFQYQLLVGGRWRRIDFAYPDRKIAIEVMGYEHHSGRARSQDDKLRANELQLMGWLVLQFTWEDVLKRPAYVARQIRAALIRR
jgi:very-short-patch-repair endonuclease